MRLPFTPVTPPSSPIADTANVLPSSDKVKAPKLSDASVKTLALQGGPMSAGEAAEFCRNPYFAEAVRVRLWDEAAKDPELRVPGFEHYAALLQQVVDRHCR